MPETQQKQEQGQSSFVDDLIAGGADQLKAKLLAWLEAIKPELLLFRAKIDGLTEKFMRERLGLDLTLIDQTQKDDKPNEESV